MSLIGQLAATTPTEIIPTIRSGGDPRVLSLLFYNAHATDDQEIEITLVRAGGTEYTLFKETLKIKEKFVLANLRLKDDDQVKAAATAATSVNYLVLPGASGGNLDAYSLDSTGARKGATTAAAQTFSGDVSLLDNIKLKFGTGDDITATWNATNLVINQAATNSLIELGIDGAGIDWKFYGDTASAYCLWDQSADTLVFSGVAGIRGAVVKTNGATAITTTRAVTRADSGGVFTVDQGTAYTITVATPTAAGERYLFQLVGPAAHDITLVATGCTFEGTITIDAATIPATGSTLKFASGAAILGDTIELISTSTSKFLVRAIGSGAGGITIA